MSRPDAPIGTVAAAFRIPTDAPEADGTIAWSHTTLVVVELTAANARGLATVDTPRALAGAPWAAWSEETAG